MVAQSGTANVAARPNICAAERGKSGDMLEYRMGGCARAWMHSCGSRYLKPSSGGRGTDVTKRSSAARSSSVKPDTACQAGERSVMMLLTRDMSSEGVAAETLLRPSMMTTPSGGAVEQQRSMADDLVSAMKRRARCGGLLGISRRFANLSPTSQFERSSLREREPDTTGNRDPVSS